MVTITKSKDGFVLQGREMGYSFHVDFDPDGLVMAGAMQIPEGKKLVAKVGGNGPGTHLSMLLQKNGIGGCEQCNKTKVLMDIWGPDKCEQEIEKLIGAMEKNAERQGLPFSRAVAEELIRFAIKKSRESQDG